MKRLLLLLLTFSTLLLARNDVPSCYDALKIENKHKNAKKELFILIDQTTIIDKKMMKYTYKNMMHFMKNGYAVNIVSFSSNTDGKYTDLVYAGTVEPLLSKKESYDVSKKILRKYKSCMSGQLKFAKKKAKKALIKVLKGASKKMPHSDILKSLADISKNIIGNSKAEEKVVLLVSDLLEHSSITSFYKKGKIKHINVKEEYVKINKSQYISDFHDAKVYVIGAGILPKKGYRDPKTLKNLTDFWRHYFKSTDADLQEIGTPMLLKDVE
jgi:hypothetical protein